MSQPGKLVAVVNTKGGTGKSTLSHLLPIALRRWHGKKSLVIDFDDQGNLTKTLLDNDYPITETAFTLVESGHCKPNVTESVDIIPADSNLPAIDHQDFSVLYKVKKTFRQYLDQYDFIFVDTPGSYGNRTAAAMTAADAVIVPLELDRFSLDALSRTKELIDTVIDGPNPDLDVIGFIPMKVHSVIGDSPRRSSEKEVFNSIKETFPGMLLPFLADREAYRRTQIERRFVTDVSNSDPKAIEEVKTLTKLFLEKA